MSTVPTQPRTAWRAALLNWIPTVLFNIVLPIVTYSVLVDWKVGEVPALLISAAWPAVETVVSLAVRRRIDEFSLFTLIFLGLSVVAALSFNSPRLILVKESAVNGLFGVVLLASLAFPRPLMFYFGRKFATSGTAESLDWWNGLWRFPGFRATQRIITAVWGVATLTAALVQIWLSYQLSVSTMVTVSNVLPIAVIVALIFWTIRYAKARQAAAQQRQDAGTPPPVTATQS